MEKIKINTRYKKLLADTITPVSIYLNIREQYKNSFLLESSDYHGNEDSYSFIWFNHCIVKVEYEKIFIVYPDGLKQNQQEKIMLLTNSTNSRVCLLAKI